MNQEPIKKQNFLQGTVILAIGTVIVKLLGFLFKVPLNNVIGTDGFSYFNTAYKVYDVLLMVSTTGLPVAMSRMISQAQTLENYAQIRKIYQTARRVFLAIGLFGMLGMALFCRQLSVMVTTDTSSWAAILALAPCVLLVCLVSAYRGFFQGQSNMTPTSVSQIFESLCRLVFGLGLAWVLMKKTGSAIYAAAGAICGVTIGSLVSTVYLNAKFRSSNAILSRSGGEAKSTRQTMRELLAIAAPITLGAAGLQLINLFDTIIFMRRLRFALQYTTEQANYLKGIYDFQLTMFAMPCALINPITISAIPNITAAITRKDTAAARQTEESALRVMALIAAPCTIGLFFMSSPIVSLLCRQYTAADVRLGGIMLSILGLGVFFDAMVLVLNAFMQAHGDVTTPVVNMLLGGILKVIVNYFLVAVPSLNIIGAPIGTVLCYAFIAVLDLLAMRKSVKTKPALLGSFLRPLIASLLMGISTLLVYRLLSGFLSSQKLACLAALAFAVLVYVVLALALRCLTYDDFMLLPKGEKLVKLLKIKEKS